MSSESIPKTFEIHLFSQRDLDFRHADETASWFKRFPGPIRTVVERSPVDIEENEEGAITCENATKHLRRLKAEFSPPETFTYLLTSSPNELNLFSLSYPDEGIGFGHVEDFEWFTTAPPSVIITRYLLELIFAHIVEQQGVELDAMSHRESRGCLFDFCGKKSELSLSLRTADICGDCMEILQGIPGSDSLLRQTVQIMEASRPLGLSTQQYLGADSHFDRWPFPVAVTRHKATQASNPLLRFLLLLDHFDSLIRYSYLIKELSEGRRPTIKHRPGLGYWVNKLAASLTNEAPFQEVIAIAEREGVVALRNEKRAHGWMAHDPREYSQDAANLENVISAIERELDVFLTSHELLMPRSISLVLGRYVVSGERLIGSHLIHPQFQVEFDEDPRRYGLTSEDQVFVSDKERRTFKQAWPYIQSAECTECRHPRILITDGGNTFIDVFIGHRTELTNGVPGPQ